MIGVFNKVNLKNKGFTLAEILVTVSIFVIVLSMISGLFNTALKAQRRSLALQELLAETSYVMEYMSRHIRMAQINTGGTCSDFAEDVNYYQTSRGGIQFKSYKADPDPEECWEFYLDSGTSRLMLKITGDNPQPSQPVTSEKLEVEDFKITLVGAPGTADYDQPRITFSLQVKRIGETANGKAEEQPSIILQTTISQRNLDVPF